MLSTSDLNIQIRTGMLDSDSGQRHPGWIGISSACLPHGGIGGHWDTTPVGPSIFNLLLTYFRLLSNAPMFPPIQHLFCPRQLFFYLSISFQSTHILFHLLHISFCLGYPTDFSVYLSLGSTRSMCSLQVSAEKVNRRFSGCLQLLT